MNINDGIQIPYKPVDELITAKEARALAISKAKDYEEKLRKDLFSELPSRIKRNSQRGLIKIDHSISYFLKEYSPLVETMLLDIKEWLESEEYGYKVDFWIKDYNSFYDNAHLTISWEG